VLTPQANTTVEPELWALAPPQTSLLTARLTSSKGTMEDRLVDYTATYAATCNDFANAPLNAIVAACTGASYLIGRDAEDALTADITRTRGVPFLTAAQAAVMALRHMDAQRIALLSPYPDSLNAASLAYWTSRGFDVTTMAGPTPQTDAFHPIYAMTGGGVLHSYE
jgi:maleate isomerase